MAFPSQGKVAHGGATRCCRSRSPLSAVLFFVLLVSGWMVEVSGFWNHPPSSQRISNNRNHQKQPCSQHVKFIGSSTEQYMNLNGFGSFGSFLNSNNNNNRTQTSGSFMAMDSDDESSVAGTVRILELPVRDMKPGGLRLFLMFYLLGLQNTPDPNTWKADQPSTEEYIIDFWYLKEDDPTERSILSVELTSESITLDRVGSSPSTHYLMQEAVIVQGLLDELELCAKDETVEEKDRLLILKEANAIDKARDALAFG